MPNTNNLPQLSVPPDHHLALRMSRQDTEYVIASLDWHCLRFNREMRCIYASPAHLRATGQQQENIIGYRPQDFWPLRTEAEAFEVILLSVMHTARLGEFDVQWRGPAGERVDLHLCALPEYNASGRVVGVLVVAHTSWSRLGRRRQNGAYDHSLHTFLGNTSDMITRFDRQGRRIYANPAAIRESGLQFAALLGTTLEEVPGGLAAQSYHARLCRVLASGSGARFEFVYAGHDGHKRCSDVTLIPEFDKHGVVVRITAVARDITEVTEIRAQLHALSSYDPLTGLANRLQCTMRLEQILDKVEAGDGGLGVLLVNLDRFQAINDALGHSVGDFVLIWVADVLSRLISSPGLVGRWGGDEFALLLPGYGSASDLALFARRVAAAFAESVVIAGHDLTLSVSIGGVCCPADARDASALIQYADAATHEAKRHGGNNFQHYSAELTRQLEERLALERDLRVALSRDEFTLHYQAQVELATGRLAGAEVLLRWNHPRMGQLLPGRFMDIAEDTGLVVEIGKWALRRACETARRWNQHGEKPLKIAVNLSGKQFLAGDLVANIKDILCATGCLPAWLELEITETLLLDERASVLAALKELRDMGFTIAIDDFGTGYSALSYLIRFPIHTLKIDRSFIRDVTVNKQSAELARAIISLAHGMDLTLVAEGVESAEQAEWLRSFNCTFAQGYWYGRPMPEAQFVQMLT